MYILNDNYKNPEDGELVATVNKSFVNSGFYTMDLDTPVALPAGTQYAVVEQITISNARYSTFFVGSLDEPIPQLPYLAIEYGLEQGVSDDLRDQYGNPVGFLYQLYRASA